MRNTKVVKVGNILIGGGNPVTIQSMTNTKTEDAKATIGQINRLYEAGCEIVRCTVNTEEAEKALPEIVRNSPIPVVADIHFSLDRALGSIKAGVHKIRFNPGNIGSEERVKILAETAKSAGVPIRVGVNGGSVEKDLLQKYGNTTTALVESALRHVALLEKFGFYDTVISVKASDSVRTLEAYRTLSQKVGYPLHIGVTEAGCGRLAEYKSVATLGALLLDGIGDTVRISISGDPVQEVVAARNLLRAVGKDENFVNVVSCPTCGRTNIPVEAIATEIAKRTENVRKPLKVAVMGCVVNGIGEGADSDVGVAGGEERSAIFTGGKIVKTVKNEDIVPTLLQLVEEKLNG